MTESESFSDPLLTSAQQLQADAGTLSPHVELDIQQLSGVVSDESEIVSGFVEVAPEAPEFVPQDVFIPRMPKWATAIAGAVLVAILMRYVPLGALFSNTTPTGGDVAGHVWFPKALIHMLPHLSGWSNDWFAGFPAGAMYFPIPALLTALLSVVLPYGVAMKITLALGALMLPASAWFFGRRLNLHPAFGAAAALATLGFQVEEFHTIYGGNLSSVFAGMFSLAIGFAFALFTAGSLVSFLNKSRSRPSKLLPWLLLATALSHLLAGVLCAVLCTVLLITYPDRRKHLRALLFPVSVGLLLSCVWAVPFLRGSSLATDMGYEPTRSWRRLLPMFWTDAPGTTWWYWMVLPLALMACVWAIASRHRGLLALAGVTGVFGFMYMTWPTTYVWDARWLPYWWWGLWMLAASALVQAGAMLWRSHSAPALLALVVAIPSLAAVGVINHLPGSPKGDLPTAASWAHWDLNGYELKDTCPEYKAVMDMMKSLGERSGCGRALWEYDKGEGTYGSPMAMMLLPYWTNGCVDSVEGLFMEGSQTTPFLFLTQHAVSQAGSGPVRDMPYRQFDLDWGVSALRSLGVRWYMTYNAKTTDAAKLRDDLTEVAHTAKWSVFEVERSALVTPLETVPEVIGGVWPQSFANAFDDDPTGNFVSSALPFGPQEPGDKLAPVTVSDIQSSDDGLSFDVSKIGVPVMVHESWYPTWSVSGATAPIRAGANMMVVIPTSTHVEFGVPTPLGRDEGELCFVFGLLVYGFWLRNLRRSKRNNSHSTHEPLFQPPTHTVDTQNSGTVYEPTGVSFAEHGVLPAHTADVAPVETFGSAEVEWK